jgi:hypothetical protein
MTSVTTIPTGPYALHAFVYPTREVHRLEPYGRVTFRFIYQNRPPEARYAVVGHYNAAAHTDEFLVWDLFKALKKSSDGDLIEPRPRLRHDDLNAAIMATVLLFGSETP